MKNWCALKIDVNNAIRKDFDINQLLVNNTHPTGLWNYIGEDKTKLFTTEWLDYMNSIGVPIAGALIFWRDSNYQHPTAHIDVAPNECSGLSAAINWCIGEDKGQMVWYELPNTTGYSDQTPVDSNYQEWEITSLIESERKVIGNTPTLVRVDVPHNVIMGDSPRLLITARTMEVFQNWDEVKTYFRTLI